MSLAQEDPTSSHYVAVQAFYVVYTNGMAKLHSLCQPTILVLVPLLLMLLLQLIMAVFPQMVVVFIRHLH